MAHNANTKSGSANVLRNGSMLLAAQNGNQEPQTQPGTAAVRQTMFYGRFGTARVKGNSHAL